MKTKNILNKIILISIIILASLLFTTPSYAADTDVINNYEINITPRKNGTLVLTYTIDWKVLDDSEVGPLIDLYVGIPNKNITEIKKLSSNINSIAYTSTSYGNSGHYLYMTFNKKYYTGDVANIKFSFVVSHMYMLPGSDCVYEFTPGWFNDVEVKNFKATCKSKGVTAHNATKTVGEQLVWQYPLDKGETSTIEITYPQNVFTVLDPQKQKSNTNTFEYVEPSYYSSSYSSSSDLEDDVGSGIVSVIIVVFIISIVLVVMFSPSNSYYKHSGYGYTTVYDYDDDDDYYMRSGYHSKYYHTRAPRRRSPRPHYSIFSSSSSWSDSSSSWSDNDSSSSSSISSCACACACAGGGRAGCSKKELYHFNSNELKKVLKK